MNVIVQPGVYERYYRTMRNSLLPIVEGKIQKQQSVLNVMVEGAVGM